MRALALSLAPCAALILAATPLHAQVTVNPTGVNVASQGATTVFLTFGGVTPDLVPAEALWCGRLVDASPDLGLRCDPATLFGSLPLRFEQARASGSGALTDIMSVPASVARRAWQAAQAGDGGPFFYVRRFASRTGARDVYVAVTCRLTSGGAGVPFSLTDVRLAFDVDAPVVAIEPNGDAPTLHADITYTGTGRLQGRWEVVLPGEDPPTEEELLTEASLPLERRGLQRRFTLLDRFSVFLPPNGRVTLPGPDPARLPRKVEGVYLVLLRIEASDDRDSQSDLSAVGAGTGPVAGGAVAGFALPTLRYAVGAGGSGGAALPSAPGAPAAGVLLLQPREGGAFGAAPTNTFTWAVVPLASRYRLEIARADGTPVFDALVPGALASYLPPPLLAERAAGGAGAAGAGAGAAGAGAAGAPLRWRVRAEDASGREIARSPWRALALPPPPLPE